MTKVSVDKDWEVVVVARFEFLTINNCISRILKGVHNVSILPLQYLSGCRTKKDTIQVMLKMSCCHSVPLWAEASMV